MVDFKKRLGVEKIEKRTNPVEIYDALDRRSETGPLRPAQLSILQEWWANQRTKKDVILKLHTGQGKTLIGLLMLQSKINSNDGPCIYVCPNIYLADQTCQQANRFGIKFAKIEADNMLPEEFLNGNKILITHIQKLFNGKTKFGLGNSYIECSTIILDDAHACIDSIKGAFTIKIPSDHQVYQLLFNLFEDDLKEQGEGSLFEIKTGANNTLLPVPYWNWIDKSTEILQILSKFKEDNYLLFVWPIIKDSIENCQCFFSGTSLEISAIYSPIHEFGTFHHAKQRIFMSATTQNDSSFIKGLGVSSEAVEKPLVFEGEIWSGEKMILIPQLINENLDRLSIINNMATPNPKRKSGVVTLTSSFNKSKVYHEVGSIVANASNIFEHVSNLKVGKRDKNLVIVNRYDGIDLPDDACRVLIIDGKPNSESLSDKYEESVRVNSDIINIKVAQKIEQGLGRSVRGEKDYSVIVLIGNDLIRFIQSNHSKKYFSEQTRKQIEIGKEVCGFAKEETKEGENLISVIYSVINQSVGRDDGWKEYYKEKMDTISKDVVDRTFLKIYDLEKQAEEFNYKKEFSKAVETSQKVIDLITNENEKGWYLQNMARYIYRLSKAESNKYQTSAFKKNLQALKPREGIIYDKLNFINEDRIKRIKSWINNHGNYEELTLALSEINEKLSFGETSDQFEKALQDLGIALGFLSQRPDKEYKKGADNLWCTSDNQYLMFECKNEVLDTREDINKHEVAQMNTHCAWFNEQYNNASVTPIMIITTKSVSKSATFGYPVQIMRKNGVKRLKDNTKSFFKEFNKYSIHDVSDDKIQEWLQHHKLDIASLKGIYTEPYKQMK
jgi:replicative superfamily II helicase